jgi:L-fuconolactonase
VWDLSVRAQPWTSELPRLHRSFPMSELSPYLVANSFDATVVVQTVPVAAETEELLALCRTERRITGVIGWVDLLSAEVTERIAALQAQSGALVGLRHQVQDEPDPRWLCRDDVRRGLAAIAAAGLSYDLLVLPGQLPAAIETVRSLPELRFVLDHAAKPHIADRELEPWRSDIMALAALPNVAVKLSGLVTEAAPDNWAVATLRPYADVLLDAFGADRVMFGSDWPVCLLVAGYDEVVNIAEQLTSRLSVAERDAVFGMTAALWYRLSG